MTVFMSHTYDGEPQFGMLQSIVVLHSNIKLIVKKIGNSWL